MQTMTTEQFVERMVKFTDESFTWCSKESEQATARVTDAIELLLKNTQRVSSISQESLAALQGLRKSINLQFSDDKTQKTPVRTLIKSLEVLASEHNEIDSVIHPIIGSLQFQDRMRQNFENMVKMINVWLEYRKKLGPAITAEDQLRFAEALFKTTTMAAERDVVRAKIPGAPKEEASAPVLLF